MCRTACRREAQVTGTPLPEWEVEVKLGGSTERYIDERGRTRVRWNAGRTVTGVPYDTRLLAVLGPPIEIVA